MDKFWAATYACNSDIPALARATGAARIVSTLKSEIPKTEMNEIT